MENVPGKGLVSRTKHDFQNKKIFLGQKANSSQGQALNFWLVPVEFTCMHFISNPRSTPGKNDDTWHVMSIARSFNVLFEDSYTWRGYTSNYDAITLPAKRNNNGGKEMFTVNGIDYKLE